MKKLTNGDGTEKISSIDTQKSLIGVDNYSVQGKFIKCLVISEGMQNNCFIFLRMNIIYRIL